jgi:pyruvate,water dikinase
MQKWAKIQPPPQVGTDYGPPPPNPIANAIGRFFGAPPPESEHPNEIRGNTGAPGKVVGTARVIMDISDGWRLEQDEILVAPTTAPPWTPLFATAAAVVTETGGILSHCAIVAREYGIPAVVGATGATTLIKDGSQIEVDGDAGTIRLLG